MTFLSCSGTTLMAAEQNGRVCYGSEPDPKYADVMVRRWQGYTGKQAVPDGDGRNAVDQLRGGSR
jgi:DNA modification methylase